jgi:hypothetical protein
MLPYAQLAPGPGFRAERALLYYLQRLATAPVARQAVAALIAAALRQFQGKLSGPPLDVEGGCVLAKLRQEGVAMLAPLASNATFERIAAYFARRPVLGPDGRRHALEELPAGCPTAEYDLQTVLGCREVMALVNAPQVLRLAEAYLGCKPTLSSLGVRWSLPSEMAPPRFQSFHRDVDDWRFLKLFIYLTDVEPDSGPHVYVRGSHRRRFGWRARSYELSEIAARFGADSLLTVTGPRGTTFVADTLGVHRGGPPSDRPRLMLQAQYSLLPVFAFQYQPLEREDRDIDPYCNRLLLRLPAAPSTRLPAVPAPAAEGR